MEKNLLYFLLLNQKQGKKQILPKSLGVGWLFCGKFKSFLSMLMFTHSASAEALSMELWRCKTRCYHHKLNVRVASRIVEQFRIYDLSKWGTFKAVYFSFHWLNYSWTCRFEVVTCGFELALLNFNSCF